MHLSCLRVSDAQHRTSLYPLSEVLFFTVIMLVFSVQQGKHAQAVTEPCVCINSPFITCLCRLSEIQVEKLNISLARII